MRNGEFNIKSSRVLLIGVAAAASLLAKAQLPPAPPAHQNEPAAQQAKGAGTAAQSGDGTRDELVAEETTGGGKDRVYNMHGWVYTRKDMTVRGTIGVYDEKKDTVVTNSPIVLDDDKYHITADNAVIEHVNKAKEQRTVTLTGHVILVLKPEKPGTAATPATPASAPSAPSATKATPAAPPAAAPNSNQKPEDKPQNSDVNENRKHGGTATCDKLVYISDGKHSTLTGHVIFKQSFEDDDGKTIDRTLTCDYAEHDGKKDILHLFKPVHFEDSKKQLMDTPNDVLVGTKEGEETISGTKMKFSFPADKDDEDNAKPGTRNEGGEKTPPRPGQKTGK
jgi:hypothetical protein